MLWYDGVYWDVLYCTIYTYYILFILYIDGIPIVSCESKLAFDQSILDALGVVDMDIDDGMCICVYICVYIYAYIYVVVYIYICVYSI